MSVQVVSALSAGAVSLTVVWYMVSRRRQRRRYPPGPTPYPVIGNLPTLLSNEKIWESFTEMQTKYGDIFTVFFAGEPTIILGNLDLIREAFLTKQNEFAGRPVSFTFDLFSNGGKDIVAGQFGPVWKRLRKITHAAFRKYASGDNLAQLINDSTQKAFVEMDKVAGTGERFNPRHSLDMIVYNIICSMVFGKTFEHNDPELKGFIKRIDEVNETIGLGLLADFFPILKYIPTPAMRTVKNVLKEMQDLVKGVYEDHQKTFDESNPTDVVYHMLASLKEAEREEGKGATEGLTEEHMQLTILDIFSAGTDTSRTTLLWGVLFMAAHPECQKKMQKEVDSLVERNEALKIEHRAHLPYIEAFLHEVMRIRPLAPLAVPHETTCDTSVGGYDIPAGTQVMPNIWAVHMDPKEWKEPTEFHPERFLTEDGQMAPRISSWLPFSTGRRVCVGEALAKTELLLSTASLVQRYQFDAPPGVTLATECISSGQFMLPNDFEVILSRRP